LGPGKESLPQICEQHLYYDPKAKIKELHMFVFTVIKHRAGHDLYMFLLVVQKLALGKYAGSSLLFISWDIINVSFNMGFQIYSSQCSAF
jgi:hypothetical protein